jgi:hypothetical protein
MAMKKILSLLIIAALIGCAREIPNPVSNPAVPEIPPAPIGLSVQVGDRTLYLSWSIADSSLIAGYRIYRTDSPAETTISSYVLIDSASTSEFTDADLQNGRYYFYKVSARNQEGVESLKSSAASGVPNLFSMIINNGDITTDTRSVTLALVAPSNTLLMQISNTSLFESAVWEPYAGTKQWHLSQGAGEKTVYARFRDSQGNSTTNYVSDNISYQIPAYGYRIEINQGAPNAYSREVELAISALSGTSAMMISNAADFSGAVWESYAAAKPWIIDPETAANGDTAFFYAIFRDELGDSVEVLASDYISLHAADPVNLLPVNQLPDYYQSVILSWSRSMSEDFYSYRLFRSRNVGAVDTIIANIIDFAQTGYTDNIDLTDLPDNNPDTIHYMVRFYSIYDDSSDSDTIQVVLRNNQPPTVSCFIAEIDFDTTAGGDTTFLAEIGWSRSEIPDFSYYVLYESTTGDTTSASPIAYSYEIGNLSHTVRKYNVTPGASFYYRVKVFDLGGRASDFSSYAVVVVP